MRAGFKLQKYEKRQLLAYYELYDSKNSVQTWKTNHSARCNNTEKRL
jgi:hypothetical protein